MNPLAICLRNLQAELGFESAKAFYEHLAGVGPLNFNYGYYMKIESAKQIPSSAVIERIAATLPENYRRTLILAFCATQFPTCEALFDSMRENPRPGTGASSATSPPAEPRFATQSANSRVTKTNELSIRQVEAITRSQTHYHVFLLLSLSRVGMLPHFLSTRLHGLDPTEALADLTEAKVIFGNAEAGYACYLDQLRFPLPKSAFLQDAYVRMAPWERAFPAALGMGPEVTKLLIRRTCKRSAELIRAHSALLLELTRAAEDSDDAQNPDVVFLELYLAFGRFEG